MRIFLFATAVTIGFIGVGIVAHEPSEPEPVQVVWLQDEEGMNIAPRITLEPKP